MLSDLRVDHWVLTVTDLERTCWFYTQALGMEEIRFGADRRALRFGTQKINLHQVGQEFKPKAQHPTPGSADLCFLTGTPVMEVERQLRDLGIPLEAGPVPRTGTQGPILSIYIRDPDGNLIEIANPINSDPSPPERDSQGS